MLPLGLRALRRRVLRRACAAFARLGPEVGARRAEGLRCDPEGPHRAPVGRLARPGARAGASGSRYAIGAALRRLIHWSSRGADCSARICDDRAWAIRRFGDRLCAPRVVIGRFWVGIHVVLLFHGALDLPNMLPVKEARIRWRQFEREGTPAQSEEVRRSHHGGPFFVGACKLRRRAPSHESRVGEISKSLISWPGVLVDDAPPCVMRVAQKLIMHCRKVSGSGVRASRRTKHFSERSMWCGAISSACRDGRWNGYPAGRGASCIGIWDSGKHQDVVFGRSGCSAIIDSSGSVEPIAGSEVVKLQHSEYTETSQVGAVGRSRRPGPWAGPPGHRAPDPLAIVGIAWSRSGPAASAGWGAPRMKAR